MVYRKTYVLLLILSVFMFFLPSTQLNILPILRFDADPLLISIFNALGLLPALFLIERLCRSKPMSKIEKWAFGFSFGLGAFALLWVLDNQMMKIKSKFYRNLYSILTVGLLGMLSFGLVYGRIESYILIWQNDLFVRIMTIDFFILISLWIKRVWTLLFRSA